MDNIKVSQEKCNGCGKCVRYCSYNAITISEGKAVIDLYACTLCNACVKKCKFGAIKITNQGKKIAPAGHKGIWVIVEFFDGELKNTSFALVSKAVELSKVSGDQVCAVLIGNKAQKDKKLISAFRGYGIKTIKLLYNEKLSQFSTEDFTEIISEEILADKPKIVLFLGTIFGRSIAPCVATKVKAGLTADCTDLGIDKNGNLLQIRPTFGGKVLATIITPFNNPQMASVRPNVFIENKSFGSDEKIDFTVKKAEIKSDVSLNKLKKILKLIKTSAEFETSLEEAKIVFCAGLGVGSKEGFKVLKEFAEKNGAAIAATRAVVDNGWADFSLQVGQTGTIVRPELYIGFGVSGAIHHIIGMRNSRKIVAINIDPRAPIFKISDYCIIADLFDVVDKLGPDF